MEKLRGYQEWIAKGMERATPKPINWSALYTVRQGISEAPSEFLDRLKDVMHQHIPLDSGDEIGKQQLVSLFLGQSTGDIRRKLQKLCPTETRDIEMLLDEAWRIFSNREVQIRQGHKGFVAAVTKAENNRGGTT